MPAPAADLPCDGDGTCMACSAKPPQDDLAKCRTCGSPWHVRCLSSPPAMSVLADGAWTCPDCSGEAPTAPAVGTAAAGEKSGLVAEIRAIEADDTINEAEKAKRRQKLLGGAEVTDEEEEENYLLRFLGQVIKCVICIQLCDRPVTTPCGHSYCLKCFQKSISQGSRTCAKCRKVFPGSMIEQPRINSALVASIRMARAAKYAGSSNPGQVCHYIRNENRPEKAFTTDRAKKSGKANACSGQIFVTVPPDHFGPILAENDPSRNRGVLVGDSWDDRLDCRQWGVHLPHVAGIAGQSDYGAQSVALSGGYQDDEDHGEWFLYTGSGGRDLSGNKRTNKDQSFDQKFEKYNAALRVSCLKGYPVRVVRSHKEKRSSYAPDAGVRYDGIYRIEKCWRKTGIQGYKVCRYLFVRCDNSAAPWSCDDHGDQPRPLPTIKELKQAIDVTDRKETPAWGYDNGKNAWMWMKPPPPSKKKAVASEYKGVRKAVKASSVWESMLKNFSCPLCKKLMSEPVTTPCCHNFCKSCLLGSYADKSFMRERTREGGRTLRAQRIVKQCPLCPADIAEYLQNPPVSTEIVNTIESLQEKLKDEEAKQEPCENEGAVEDGNECNDPEMSAECDGSNCSIKKQQSKDDSGCTEIESVIKVDCDENSDDRVAAIDGCEVDNQQERPIRKRKQQGEGAQGRKKGKTCAGANCDDLS